MTCAYMMNAHLRTSGRTGIEGWRWQGGGGWKGIPEEADRSTIGRRFVSKPERAAHGSGRTAVRPYGRAPINMQRALGRVWKVFIWRSRDGLGLRSPYEATVIRGCFR